MATGVAALPDDALAGVFRGLPLRSLAVARCVCKAWRDIVDARQLLLPHLLPHSVRGVFLNYVDHKRPHHMARPCPSSMTIPKVDGMLSFLPNDRNDWWSIMDHCNGLLLCDIERGSELCVCNPATSRWTRLPRPQVTDFRYYHYAGAYIAFDPAESPHFQVILIPTVPNAPSPEDHLKNKKEKERRTLWEEEGGASFCLDWFFAMADDGEAISDEEVIEAAQGEDGLFSVAKDGGTPIGEEKADGNHKDEFHEQLAEEDNTTIGEEKGEANNKEFQQLPSSVDEDLELDIDPWRFMEWPLTPWTLHVFSSRTGHWEERAFVRQGMPAGTVEKMRLDKEEPTFYGPRRRYAVFHHGSLYVHCRGSFVIRLSLSNDEYQIIETPTKVEYAKPYLGNLQKDVCFGIVDNDHRQLKIWMLRESSGQMEWVLKYEVEVGHYAQYIASLPYDDGRQPDGSWTVEEDNTDIQESYEWDSDDGRQPDGSWTVEEDNTDIQESYEWDSDNDDTFTVDHLKGQEYYYQGLDIIGFHPFKEVVFMTQPFGVVAYHLNATKIQYLGNSRPKCYYHNHSNGIYESFLYTPCMIGHLLYGDETSG